MERDGLLHIAGDRQLALTDAGRALATRVMRKHRLAECLLVSVIQMPWEEVHIEACRWEHVISESVEQRLYELLGHPERCPHGNVIPGLGELVTEAGTAAAAHDATMADVTHGTHETTRVTVTRITEQLQSDLDLMLKLKRAGIQPGREVLLGAVDGGVRVGGEDEAGAASVDLSSEIASHVFVSTE
jgi:DtxR family transcriptional regulator, Mn-dependent transcriptional regulator